MRPLRPLFPSGAARAERREQEYAALVRHAASHALPDLALLAAEYGRTAEELQRDVQEWIHRPRRRRRVLGPNTF